MIPSLSQFRHLNTLLTASRHEVGRMRAWLPWLGVALLVAAVLSPGTVTASRLVFQSPPEPTRFHQRRRQSRRHHNPPQHRSHQLPSQRLRQSRRRRNRRPRQFRQFRQQHRRPSRQFSQQHRHQSHRFSHQHRRPSRWFYPQRRFSSIERSAFTMEAITGARLEAERN